jgi:hypothetical protein
LFLVRWVSGHIVTPLGRVGRADGRLAQSFETWPTFLRQLARQLLIWKLAVILTANAAGLLLNLMVNALADFFMRAGSDDAIASISQHAS